MSSELYISAPSHKIAPVITKKIQDRARQTGKALPANLRADIEDFGEVVVMQDCIPDEYLTLMGAPNFPGDKEGTIAAAKWLEEQTGCEVEAYIRFHWYGGFRDQQLYPPRRPRVKGLAYDREDGNVYVTGKTLARWEEVEERVDALHNKVK